GMKAPRWPEYFLRSWLERASALPSGARVTDNSRVRRHTLDFITQIVGRYRDRDAIAYWQVENEPLDPARANSWRIGEDFLREEVALVRRLDPRGRPVVVNMFVSPETPSWLPFRYHEARERAEAILEVADILGLDIYPSVWSSDFACQLNEWTGSTWER